MSKISEMKSAIEKGYEYFSAQEMKSVIAEAEKQIDLLTLGLLQEKGDIRGYINEEEIKELATTVNKVAESVVITTAKQFQKQIEQLRNENKRLRDFAEYVASIDCAIVSDPNNENPLSMGELQADAKQALA